MMKRKFSFLSLVLASIIVLSGCGSSGGSGDKVGGDAGTGVKKGGILKVAMIGNPPTLDIHTSTTTIVEQVTFNVTETLFALDSKFQPQPMLAESYEWKNDNKQLVIKLRQGVTFHNGDEMTAEDAAASVSRWLQLASLGKQIAPKVESVKAADKHTVEINLKAVVGTLVASLANPNNQCAIMPKRLLDETGDKPLAHDKVIGTGPYKIAEFAQDKMVRLVRFDKYSARTDAADGYAGKKEAILDEIHYIPVPEAQTRKAGLQTGEYHFAFQIPQDHYAQLKDLSDLQMVINKPTGWSTLVFNKKPGMSIFSDVRLRRAVNYAIDPGPAMLAAFGDPAFIRLDSSISPKESPFFGEFDNGQYNKRDLAKAKALLQEAGYDGKPIRLMATKEYPYMYNYSVVVKQQLEEAGFKVDMQVVDWATLVQRRSKPEEYDIFTTGFIFSPLPTAHNVFLSPTWPGWWENADLQKALDDFNAEVDIAKQKVHWDKVQMLFWDEIPAIKLGDYFNLNVVRKEVQNFQQMPNTFFWNTWLAE